LISEKSSDAARQALNPSTLGADVRILIELDESREQIARWIEDVGSVTEREVLACGHVLGAIVDKARHLTDESDRAVASSMRHSEEITGHFVKGMREDIVAQETAVQSVLKMASGIEAAVAAINDLTLSSKVLAINARIEAARLGAQGKGFAVIADSLSGLSGVIRGASDTVSSSIDAIRKGLPQMSASAASMSERTNVFIEQVSRQVKSAALQTGNGQSDGSLAELTELSNQALSHLQFQDSMAQKLLSINGNLTRVKERVRQLLDGSDLLAVEESAAAASGSQPPPGEIMLF
jgi:methyl-accepting chemotaxis protein